MDIAALSISLNQSNLAQQVGVRLVQMTKEQTQQQGQDLVQMLERSVQPNLGGNLNIRT